jgi:ferredoxin-NADP reductase
VDYGRRIDRAMLQALLSEAPAEHVFVCGSNGFVGTVADALVDLGVLPSTILTERYGG